MPAYADGDRVEYFSPTCGLWLLGEAARLCRWLLFLVSFHRKGDGQVRREEVLVRALPPCHAMPVIPS